MKRRDFLRLSAAPALVPLLEFYPKEILEELEKKETADLGINSFGSMRYVTTIRSIKGPAMIDKVRIVGPWYGGQQHKPFPAIFKALISHGKKKFTMLRTAVNSDQAYSWQADPLAYIYIAENEHFEIAAKNEGVQPYHVFTTYRVGS